MITKIRVLAPSIMVIALAGFIATIFFSWGMNVTGGNGNKRFVGSIDGKKVPLAVFNQQVQAERKNRLQQANGELSERESAMIPRQVWEAKVSREINARVFDNMALKANADEIYTYLKNNPPASIQQHPAFQTDSVFDSTKYIRFLNDPQSLARSGIQQLEQHIATMLLPMQKLEFLINEGIFVSQSQCARMYRKYNEKVVYEYVKAYPRDFPVDSAAVTPDMITSYYKTHTDSFYRDAQASLYVARIDKNPTAQDIAEYKKEMTELRQQIVEDEISFEEAARLQSDDENSARKGGTIGWVSRGSLVPDFEKAAFSLDTGEISEPVRTRFGFHLIMLEDTRVTDSIEEIKVRHILRRTYPSSATLDRMEETADSLITQLRQQHITTIQEHYDTSVIFDSTGYLTAKELNQRFNYLQGLGYFAFEEDPGTVVTSPYENDEAIFVFKIRDRRKKGTLALEHVRTRIRRTLMDSLQRRNARDYLARALENIDAGASLVARIDTTTHLETGITDTVTRVAYVNGIGKNATPTAAAFATAPQTTSPPVSHGNAVYAVRPLWHTMVDTIPWDSPEITAIRQQLYNSMARNIYMRWYAAQKQQHRITSHIDTYYM
jgi:peptidyl-prolyl cis-trans isomerase D